MKVGVYIPNWIGDCVMSLTFLHECKKQHQNDEIICVAREWVSPVLERNPYINELIIIKKDQDKNIRNILSFSKLLRSKNIDIFYILSDSWRSAIFAWISGAKQRIGFDRYKKSILFSNSIHSPYKDIHRSQKYLYLLDIKKIDTKPDIKIKLSEEEQKQSIKYLNQLNINSFMGLFIGSNVETRRPNVDFWIKICKKALKDKMKILIFGSKTEDIISNKIINELNNKNISSFCGKGSLRETISLISFSKGVIATDSGLGHISANLGIPTISLFAAGNPIVTGPIGKKIKIINKNIYCSQCGKPKCKEPLICLHKIDSDNVWNSYLKLIN